MAGEGSVGCAALHLQNTSNYQRAKHGPKTTFVGRSVKFKLNFGVCADQEGLTIPRVGTGRAPPQHTTATRNKSTRALALVILPSAKSLDRIFYNIMATTGLDLAALIEAKGQEIRVLKTEGTPKDALKPHIDELLSLKAKFKATTGEAYVAPGQEKKSKPAAPPSAAPAGEAEAADPNKKSKKQLQREKKEAEKAAAKAKAKEERERKQAEAAAQGATQERCGHFVLLSGGWCCAFGGLDFCWEALRITLLLNSELLCLGVKV